MATHVYRYRWQGVDINEINSQIDPAFPTTASVPAPTTFIDITADDSTKDDLDIAMIAQGWLFFATDPSNVNNGLIVKQVSNIPRTVDITTTSSSFVTLLSTTITTDDGFLIIEAAATASATTTGVYFRLLRDGVVVANGGGAHDIGLTSVTLLKRVPIVAGSHTIELQWRVDSLGSASIRPVTFPDAESATLRVIETT